MKRLSNLMLLANLLSTIFYSMSYPYIYKYLVEAVSSEYIGMEQLIACVGSVVIGTLWNKYGDNLFPHYAKIVVAETVADLMLFIGVIVTGNLKSYFIFNVLIYAVITKNLSCGGIKMRAKVNPTEQLRERFDNNSNSINSVATILGTLMELIFDFELSTLFILAMIGGIIDNFIYMYIFKKLRKDEKSCLIIR